MVACYCWPWQSPAPLAVFTWLLLKSFPITCTLEHRKLHLIVRSYSLTIFNVLLLYSIMLLLFHTWRINQLFRTADKMYTIPFYRATVYVMGIAVGYLLRVYRNTQLTNVCTVAVQHYQLQHLLEIVYNNAMESNIQICVVKPIVSIYRINYAVAGTWVCRYFWWLYSDQRRWEIWTTSTTNTTRQYMRPLGQWRGAYFSYGSFTRHKMVIPVCSERLILHYCTNRWTDR